MAQAALSPVIATQPTQAINASTPRGGKDDGGKTASDDTGGFADALRQQLTPHRPAHRARHLPEEEGTETADSGTVPAEGTIPAGPQAVADTTADISPSDAFPELAATTGTGTTASTAQADAGVSDSTTILPVTPQADPAAQVQFAPPELAAFFAPRPNIIPFDDGLPKDLRQAGQRPLEALGEENQSGQGRRGPPSFLSAEDLRTADFAVPGKADAAFLGNRALSTEQSIQSADTRSLRSLNSAITADTQGESAFRAALAAAQQNAIPAETRNGPLGVETRTVIDSPVGSPRWSEDVGNTLVWMTNRDQQKAELVLTPASLGRIEVSITVANDQATAHFVAASAAARDALEQSLPRLREMFAANGISLGQASVNAESSAGQQFGEARRDGNRRFGGPDGVEAVQAAALPRTAARNGLVDTFV